jgi:hypothetical protein
LLSTFAIKGDGSIGIKSGHMPGDFLTALYSIVSLAVCDLNLQQPHCPEPPAAECRCVCGTVRVVLGLDADLMRLSC